VVSTENHIALDHPGHTSTELGSEAGINMKQPVHFAISQKDSKPKTVGTCHKKYVGLTYVSWSAKDSAPFLYPFYGYNIDPRTNTWSVGLVTLPNKQNLPREDI
jgi:hypothetical protein